MLKNYIYIYIIIYIKLYIYICMYMYLSENTVKVIKLTHQETNLI